MNKLSFFLLLILSTAFVSLQAQRVSLTANFSSFDIDRASSNTANISYAGSTTLTGNLRILSEKKWALRLGAGVDNLTYRVEDGVSTNYQARRQDLRAIIGVEKHATIANFLTIYPGAYIPIIVVGEDKISANFQNIKNGNVRAGLGVVLGANIRLFKILRVGVEFDASYDNFKEAVWESADQLSLVPIRGINHTTAFTLGVAF